MLKKSYNNFVKAGTSSETIVKQPSLTGEQAQEIYLKEIQDAKNCTTCASRNRSLQKRKTTIESVGNISNKDLFNSVQNNDVEMLKNILDTCPNKINTVDIYGWSLLMMACQANSVDSVKELLNRGIDTSVRDKGGNSATNLVIRNKNLVLADILLNYRKNNLDSSDEPTKHRNKSKIKVTEKYKCEICDKVFPDKDEHLASTVHNISASKDKKIPTNYVIPQTNKGYQLMLKVGWDRECGLGRDGSGKKYPIKAVPKKDRRGLGHENKKDEPTKEYDIRKNSKLVTSKSRNDRNIEKNFRREFY